MKNKDEPHVRYDLKQVKRCGANTRAGAACQQPAMSNGKCRLHGGKSTGPRTPEGLGRSRKANWRHGYYSAQERNLNAYLTELERTTRSLIDRFD